MLYGFGVQWLVVGRIEYGWEVGGLDVVEYYVGVGDVQWFVVVVVGWVGVGFG